MDMDYRIAYIAEIKHYYLFNLIKAQTKIICSEL